MYKTIVLFFLLSPVFGYTQNWELIQEYEIYYYSRTDSVGIVNTMRVDSSYTIENITYYVLYDNYLLPKDTCVYMDEESDEESNSISTIIAYPSDSLCKYYYPNGSILGKVIFTNNGFEYYFNGGHRLLKTQGQIGESWLFDSVDSLYAELVSISESNQFGPTDSVKTIHISNSGGTLIDSIKIAKNHGLVLYPIGNGSYYQNEGIQSDHFNEAFMTFDQLFAYQVGDVFVLEYSKVHAGDLESVTGISRFEVTSIDSSGLFDKYICDVAHKRYTYDSNDNYIENTAFISGQIYDPFLLYGSSYSFPGEIGILEMNSDVINVGDFSLEIEANGLTNFGFENSFSSSYSMSYYDAYNTELTYGLFSDVGVNDTDRVIVKGLPWGCFNCDVDDEYYPKSFSSIWSSVLDGFHVNISSGVIASIEQWCHIYQEGFGLVYMGVGHFEQGESIRLLGAIKDGISYGNVPTSSYLLSVEDLSFEDLDILAYPVPFTDSFVINNNEQCKVEVRIYSLEGKKLFEEELILGENKLDMTAFNGNTFILKFSSDKGVSTQKVFRVKD